MQTLDIDIKSLGNKNNGLDQYSREWQKQMKWTNGFVGEVFWCMLDKPVGRLREESLSEDTSPGSWANYTTLYPAGLANATSK